MLTSLKIEDFRGIARGKLEDLPMLALLTGPNGSGKSTILEALQIGAGWSPSDSVGRVIVRRMEVKNGPRWLLHRGDLQVRPKFWAEWDSGEKRYTKLWVEGNSIGIKLSRGDKELPDLRTIIKRSDRYESEHVRWGKTAPPEVRFLDQRIGSPRSPLHDCYSETLRRGGAEQALMIVRQLDETILRMEILTDLNEPMLHLVYADASGKTERPVPVGLAGDGTESLVRLALELSMRDKGTVLVEEPEAHQHTAAIVQSARVLVTAARLGCQVILTTHSMELLDAMLFELKTEERNLLAVYRTRLQDGELRVLRVAGKEVAEARTGIGDDLR